MTPCQKLGLAVGDQLLAVATKNNTFPAGSIVKLVEDDGSNLPFFKQITGRDEGRKDGFPWCEYLEHLRPLFKVVENE